LPDALPILVRVEAEHRPADEIGWSVFDHADGEVPVLHRGGELALLEGSAHHRVLASRHAAAEDEGLGAAAHPAVHGADDHVGGAGIGQLDGPDLALAGGAEPERAGRVSHLSFLPGVNRSARADVMRRWNAEWSPAPAQ